MNTDPTPAAECERCAHRVIPGCPDCTPGGSITLDSLSCTAEEILDGVTDEASARDRLARLAAERADWAPHGFVPVPVGWLRHFAAAAPGEPSPPAAPEIDWRAAYNEIVGAAARSRYLEERLAEVRDDLLDRCDTEDRVTGEYGWIQTTEIRALLSGGEQ